MIALDLRVDGLDPEGLYRLRRLLRPPPPPYRPVAARAAPAPLVLILDGAQVIKAARVPLARDALGPGPVRIDAASLSWVGPSSLGALRRDVGAKVAVAIELEAMERVARTIDARADGGDDVVAQGLVVLRALKAELGHGIHLDPDPFRAVPVPSFSALQQTLDLLLPDDRSAGVFLFERGSARAPLWASGILEKRRGHIVRLTSHRALGIEPDGFLAGRHREVLDAMARAIAPPHLAIFSTLDAWRDIVGPQPGALAQQLAMKGAIIDPAPPWLVALTGAAAVAGVAQEATRLFGRFVPDSLKATARAVAQSASQSQASPFAQLGFDPIQLFNELRQILQ